MNSVEISSPVAVGISSEGLGSSIGIIDSASIASFESVREPSFESILAYAQTSVLLAHIGRIDTFLEEPVKEVQPMNLDKPDESILAYAQTSVLLAHIGRIDTFPKVEDQLAVEYIDSPIADTEIHPVTDRQDQPVETFEDSTVAEAKDLNTVSKIMPEVEAIVEPKIEIMPEKIPDIKLPALPEIEQPQETQVEAQPDVQPLPKVIPKLEPKIAPYVRVQPELETEPETKSETQTSPVAIIKAASQPQLQTASEVETKAYEPVEEEEELFKETPENGLDKRRLVLDNPVLAIRLSLGRLAARLAFTEAYLEGKQAVSGEDVAKFMPEEYMDVRSGALKQDTDYRLPDGTYELTETDINTIGNVSSQAELMEKVESAIYPHKPLIRVAGSFGEVAKTKERDEVYLHAPKKPPLEEVVVYKKQPKITRVSAESRLIGIAATEAAVKVNSFPKGKSLGLTGVKSLG